MNDIQQPISWVAETDLVDASGLPPRMIRQKRAALPAVAWKREDRHVYWTRDAAERLLRALGAADPLPQCQPSEKNAPAPICATPEPALFTVIRSAPQIRNKTVVEAVRGRARSWKEAAATREGVVIVRVKDNHKIRPGLCVEAIAINGDHYWKMTRFYHG